VDRRQSAEDDVVFQFDVPGEGDSVGEHAVFPDEAIMGHVDVGHEQRAGTNFSHMGSFRAPVQGDVFTHDDPVTELHEAVLTIVFKVLRHRPNYCAREDFTAFANAGPIHDGHVRPNPSVVSDDNVLGDGRERLHGDILPDFSIGMNVSQPLPISIEIWQNWRLFSSNFHFKYLLGLKLVPDTDSKNKFKNKKLIQIQTDANEKSA
jgi:hypothetical protein